MYILRVSTLKNFYIISSQLTIISESNSIKALYHSSFYECTYTILLLSHFEVSAASAPHETDQNYLCIYSHNNCRPAKTINALYIIIKMQILNETPYNYVYLIVSLVFMGNFNIACAAAITYTASR